MPVDQTYWLGARVRDDKIVFFGFFRTESDATRGGHVIPPGHIDRQGPPAGGGHRRAVRVLRAGGRACAAWSATATLARLGPDGRRAAGGARGAPPTRRRAPSFSTGLFHLAILVPDRAELARSLRRVIEHGLAPHRRLRPPRERGALPPRPRGQRHRDLPRPPARGVALATAASSRWPRCRSTSTACWPTRGAATADERRCPPGRSWATCTSRCADIPEAEGSTTARSASTSTVRAIPGRSSSSAGGYHHHIGLNTWHSQGAPAPPEGSLGLDRYELVLPDEDERDAAAGRVGETGDPAHTDDGVLATRPVREPRAAAGPD